MIFVPMDRGDNGFVMHESFKDLKARRAEQEAYRKALEEQIMQKRKLQEKERDKLEGRRSHNETMPLNTPRRASEPQMLSTPRIHSPEAFAANLKPTASNVGIPQSTPLYGRPTSKAGRILSFNEIDNYDEPHPAAIAAATKENSEYYSTASPGIPQFSPECLKYLQQVMPGFMLPPLPVTPVDQIEPKNPICRTAGETVDRIHSESNRLYDTQEDSGQENRNQAFSSGTTSESSSVEDVQTRTKAKIHVSQTSEQLEGVKISRKQYREELQKQIDERKRREEELRRKAEEEEARIQEKIRIEQEKMQREYEDELRKQEEREREAEREAERKRLATLAKQKELIARAHENSKLKCSSSKEKIPDQNGAVENLKNSKTDPHEVRACPTTSEDSIESIDEFFDDTMIPRDTNYVNPDDRIIPVVAKRLREKSMQNEKCSNSEQDTGQTLDIEKIPLTARIESAIRHDHKTHSYNESPPGPLRGLLREMAIRSAPCPPTTNSTDLEFLSTLKHYLESEKNKMDERMQARSSKSTENF